MFLDAYRRLVQVGRFEPNPAQEQAALLLQEAFDHLIKTPRLYSRLKDWCGRGTTTEHQTGLWLWGSVGSGKTTLLNLFFLTLPVQKKRRLHFHRLMHYVHLKCKELEDQEKDNPLDLIARDLASRYRVICLDEFFVSDIADAMILSGFLKGLWKHGVTLVATSNTHPDNLYKDGLQRERFLPAIEEIKTHMKVFEVSGDTDYRTLRMQDGQTYHLANDTSSEQAMIMHFEHISMGHERRDTTIEIEHRQIPVKRLSHDAIWFDFAFLCDAPRSTNDYIEISRCFAAVLVSGIPVFDEEMNDCARRFMHMVDEFYDRSVKLMVSAQAEPQYLYQGDTLRTEFERTTSRLLEMRSQEYLSQPHVSH